MGKENKTMPPSQERGKALSASQYDESEHA